LPLVTPRRVQCPTVPSAADRGGMRESWLRTTSRPISSDAHCSEIIEWSNAAGCPGDALTWRRGQLDEALWVLSFPGDNRIEYPPNGGSGANDRRARTPAPSDSRHAASTPHATARSTLVRDNTRLAPWISCWSCFGAISRWHTKQGARCLDEPTRGARPPSGFLICSRNCSSESKVSVTAVPLELPAAKRHSFDRQLQAQWKAPSACAAIAQSRGKSSLMLRPRTVRAVRLVRAPVTWAA